MPARRLPFWIRCVRPHIVTSPALTFSGIQLIFLGILGEYIGAIFDEVKRRPHYIVEESINLDA